MSERTIAACPECDCADSDARIVVGNDNNTTCYHTEECRIAKRHTTRRIDLDAHPHLDECSYCADDVEQAYVGQSPQLTALKEAAEVEHE